jgi:hypothetical protein
MDSDMMLFFFTGIFVLLVLLLILETGVGYILRYVRLKNKETCDQDSQMKWNIVSILTTTILSIYGIVNMSIDLPCDDPMITTDRHHNIPLVLFVSYLLYDILKHNIQSDMMYHHILGIVATFITVFINYTYGIRLILAGLFTELSTIPLTATYLTNGMTKTIFMMIFVLTFFLTRNVYMPLLFFNMRKCMSSTPIFLISWIIVLLINVLNTYWFILICKKIYKRMVRGKAE